jgi:hypothetical protein
MKTFPHRKHIGPDKLVGSDSPIDLSSVLDEIKGMHAELEE